MGSYTSIIHHTFTYPRWNSIGDIFQIIAQHPAHSCGCLAVKCALSFSQHDIIGSRRPPTVFCTIVSWWDTPRLANSNSHSRRLFQSPLGPFALAHFLYIHVYFVPFVRFFILPSAKISTNIHKNTEMDDQMLFDCLIKCRMGVKKKNALYICRLTSDFLVVIHWTNSSRTIDSLVYYWRILFQWR